MKGYVYQNGNKIAGVSILESIIPNKQKLYNLIKALSAFNLNINPSVQTSNKKHSWVH